MKSLKIHCFSFQFQIKDPSLDHLWRMEYMVKDGKRGNLS